jgi:hypothetical protein
MENESGCDTSERISGIACCVAILSSLDQFSKKKF